MDINQKLDIKIKQLESLKPLPDPVEEEIYNEYLNLFLSIISTLTASLLKKDNVTNPTKTYKLFLYVLDLGTEKNIISEDYKQEVIKKINKGMTDTNIKEKIKEKLKKFKKK